MVTEKNFASLQKQENQKLKKTIANAKRYVKSLKKRLSQNQCDKSEVSMDILMKENEELKLKVERLEKERDAETEKSLQCRSENLTNRELILELKTKQSKFASDLEICKSTDADLLISGQELKECNEDLEAEMKKSLRCESEKKNCLDGTISKDRKILELQSNNAKITSELQSGSSEHIITKQELRDCEEDLENEIEAKEKLQEKLESFRPLWSEWSACSKHCRGVKTRMDQCSFNNKETEPCNENCSKSGKSVAIFPTLIFVFRILFSFSVLVMDNYSGDPRAILLDSLGINQIIRKWENKVSC